MSSSGAVGRLGTLGRRQSSAISRRGGEPPHLPFPWSYGLQRRCSTANMKYS